MVRWLQHGDVKRLSLGNLVKRCCGLLRCHFKVQVVHVFKECNRVADILANEALSLSRGLHLYDEPSVVVRGALLDDAFGVTWPMQVFSYYNGFVPMRCPIPLHKKKPYKDTTATNRSESFLSLKHRLQENLNKHGEILKTNTEQPNETP